jgi:hypothetical protein
VGGIARNRLARLNPDGSLDVGFSADVGESGSFPYVNSTALQADGKIVIGGHFSWVGGTARKSIARLNADGTLDPNLDPNSNGEIFSTVVQADGKILLGGGFNTVGGVARTGIVRLANDAATQSLAVRSGSRVEWLRGGASPETHYVAFELSTDRGTNWTFLGVGTRIPGGWELAGLSLPAAGQVRARARVPSGQYNGSSGLVETVVGFSVEPDLRLTGATRLTDGVFQFRFNNKSGTSFTALATTNLTLPSSNWTVLGPATEIFPGQFQCSDSAATNFPRRFYQIRSP